MATLDEAFARLQDAIGAENTSGILRRLLHVPGALDWLKEEPVHAALVRSAGSGDSPAATALVAATGHTSLTSLPSVWPPALAARLEALLSGQSAGDDLSADDVLILAGEVLRTERGEGAQGVGRMISAVPVDWRAPLAVAWEAVVDRQRLAASLAESSDRRLLAALGAALRANGTDDEAACALAAAAAAHLDVVLLRLVEAGEANFAAAVAAAAGRPDSAKADVPPASRPTPGTLRRRLQDAWETRRGELAALADGLAIVAAQDGDIVSALEARQQALQFGPSDARLANVALSFVEKGDAAAALSLLPPTSTTPSLGFAAGTAYLQGGAVEKGRGILIEAALNALEVGDPKASPSLAFGLVACGEPGLALDVFSAALADVPSDVSTRCAYAQALAECGDDQGALAQARLALALDSTSASAIEVEAQALQRLGRPAEALAALKALAGDPRPATWKKVVDCAIAVGDTQQAQALLLESPSGVPSLDRTLLGAKVLVAEGRGAEGISQLEVAAQENPSEPALWLGLSRLHQDLGNVEASGETLRRASQMAPGAAPIYAALAHWLRVQSRPSEALESARQALEIDARDSQANLETGAALLALGRPAEAVEPLRTAHRRLPGNQETRMALASAYEATGEFDAARTLFAHLPENAAAEAWLISGRLELMGDVPPDPARARNAAGRLLRARVLGSHDLALPYWLARAYEDSGDAERAAQCYAEYVQAAPRDAPQAKFAALHRAQCLLQAGDTLSAIRTFEALRAADGQDPKFLEPLAGAYLAVSLIDEARQTAESLLTADPANRAGLHVLAAVAQQTGDWKRAAAAYHSATAQAEGDAGLWLDSAEASLHAGESTAAAGAVEKALAGPGDLALRRRAAHVLVGLGLSTRAATLLKGVASAQPEEPSVWIELADVAEGAGDLPTSIDALSHVAGLVPGDAEIQARRAAALGSAGRQTESIGAWQKTLELTPNDVRIQRSLARALVDNEEFEAGLNQFAEGLRHHPADAALLAEAGLATLRHGSAQEAVDLLTRAAAEAPTSPTLAALGEAWLRLKQPARAFEVLTKATSLPTISAAAWALYAEAAVSIGDLAAAKLAIVEARRPDSPTPDDRLALARAELRLANWNDALTALTPILSTTDARGETALAETIVRVLEARWLFGEAALARRHAPRPDVPSDSLITWLETCLAGPLGAAKAGRSIAYRLRLTRSPEDEEAMQGLQSTSADYPAVDGPLEALAIAHLRCRRPFDALDVLRQCQPDDLGASWQALLAGIAHLQGGNPSLARQAFVDAAEDAGLRPAAQSLLARAHLAQGYSDSAIAALNSALAQWSDEPAWHAALADLYLAQTDLDSALPHLQAAVELDPENTAWRLAYARALRQAGHLSESLHAYERLLPLLPSEAQVWHEAGELALAGGDFTQAESLFERAASIAPTEPQHLVGQAQAALAAGKMREARRWAESALRLGGDRPDALQCLAAVAAKQGEPDQALALLERAAAVAKDPVALRETRTRLLIEIGRAGLAAEELRTHLATNPDDDGAWRSLAEALEATEGFPAAGQALEAALRLTPRSAALHVRLARVERKSGQLDRALDLLRQAETLNPLEADLALELGQVYEARRELDHALDAYCRSAEAHPRAPEAFRRAAHVFKALKAYGEAERMLERAAELDPTDTATLQQLAAVRALEFVHGGTYRMAVNP